MSWDDFEKRRKHRNAPADDAPDEIAEIFASVFKTDNGLKVLDYLRLVTKEQSTNPDISSCALRHLEGQRHLVSRIEILIARGLKEDVRSFRTKRGRKYNGPGNASGKHSANAGWFARKFLGR